MGFKGVQFTTPSELFLFKNRKRPPNEELTEVVEHYFAGLLKDFF